MREHETDTSETSALQIQSLLEDLLAELRRTGVQILPWEAVQTSVRSAVMAVAYPRVHDDVPAQVFLRPLIDVKLAIVVARDVQRRLRAHDAEDPEACVSYDPQNDRPVALIYDFNHPDRR